MFTSAFSLLLALPMPELLKLEEEVDRGVFSFSLLDLPLSTAGLDELLLPPAAAVVDFLEGVD